MITEHDSQLVPSHLSWMATQGPSTHPTYLTHHTPSNTHLSPPHSIKKTMWSAMTEGAGRGENSVRLAVERRATAATQGIVSDIFSLTAEMISCFCHQTLIQTNWPRLGALLIHACNRQGVLSPPECPSEKRGG